MAAAGVDDWEDLAAAAAAGGSERRRNLPRAVSLDLTATEDVSSDDDDDDWGDYDDADHESSASLTRKEKYARTRITKEQLAYHQSMQDQAAVESALWGTFLQQRAAHLQEALFHCQSMLVEAALLHERAHREAVVVLAAASCQQLLRGRLSAVEGIQRAAVVDEERWQLARLFAHIAVEDCIVEESLHRRQHAAQLQDAWHQLAALPLVAERAEVTMTLDGESSLAALLALHTAARQQRDVIEAAAKARLLREHEAARTRLFLKVAEDWSALVEQHRTVCEVLAAFMKRGEMVDLSLLRRLRSHMDRLCAEDPPAVDGAAAGAGDDSVRDDGVASGSSAIFRSSGIASRTCSCLGASSGHHRPTCELKGK